jgi:dCTP deaminase
VPELDVSGEGILPVQWLRKAVDQRLVTSDMTIPDSSFQPASLDLRLGEYAHRLRCSFLPGPQAVEERLEEHAMGRPIDLRDGAILERNRPYLIPLLEELDLPANLRAKANPRSSTGRVDVFTRVITDHGFTFDDIRAGYRGKLYLEVVSRSFTVMVQTRTSLNQLRLVHGRSRCSDDQVRALHADAPVLFEGGDPVAVEALTVADGLFLSLDLSGDARGHVGFRAKKNSRLLDLRREHSHDADEFWEPVPKDRGNRAILEPEEFYLLLSAEGVRVPPGYAAEMTAYDPTSGELRTHYAGFFDPGFGHTDGGRPAGSKAALEVRAHDVPFMVEHRQKVCKLAFERMVEAPTLVYGAEIGSAYQNQTVTLSRHFVRPAEGQRGHS